MTESVLFMMNVVKKCRKTSLKRKPLLKKWRTCFLKNAKMLKHGGIKQRKFWLFKKNGKQLVLALKRKTMPFGKHSEVCVISFSPRSEERRVGKECRSRWSAYD